MSQRQKHRLVLRCAQLESRLVADAGGPLTFAPLPVGATDQFVVRALADEPSQSPENHGILSPALVDQAFALSDADEALWQRACAFVRQQAAAHPTLRYRPDLHEDLVQEVYLDWHQWRQKEGKPADSPPRLAAGSPERADFQRAVERVFGRERTRLKREPQPWDAGQEPAPAAATNERAWDEAETALTSALATLPPEQRRVVELYGEGKTFQEIGRELSCSKQRAWRAWDRAYDHVRSCLAGD